MLTDPAEKKRLAELNAAAGRKARSSIAYATARDFFAAAAALLPEETWDTRYDFQFALFLDWAETEYLRGVFEQAERLFDRLLARADNDLHKAAVYELRLKVYQIAGDWDEAVAMGLKALRLFGVEIPPDDATLERETQAAATAVKVNLQGREIAELADAPEATDPRAKAVIDLLSGVAPTTYASSRPQLFPLLILKLVNYSLVVGPTKESCHGYSAYGFLLGSLFNDPHSGCAFSEMSIKLSERTTSGFILSQRTSFFWRRHFPPALTRETTSLRALSLSISFGRQSSAATRSGIFSIFQGNTPVLPRAVGTMPYTRRLSRNSSS
ncbi:MAG: hypothetical protein P8Z80_21250 [Pseudolabrys sp.]